MESSEINREFDDVWKAVDSIRASIAIRDADYHQLEKEFVEMRTDMKHVRGTLDQMNANLNKLMFIIGGSFIAAIVGFIVSGGLV